MVSALHEDEVDRWAQNSVNIWLLRMPMIKFGMGISYIHMRTRARAPCARPHAREVVRAYRLMRTLTHAGCPAYLVSVILTSWSQMNAHSGYQLATLAIGLASISMVVVTVMITGLGPSRVAVQDPGSKV